MAHRPKVSIVTISYNQKAYILQALESFVMQRASFDFEIVVADDASTDGTREIIEKFAKEHPDTVRPILRKRNVGVQENLFDAIRKARGDYIALCEGDDFWTDDLKLQIQADFLDNNADYTLVFHPVRVFFQNSEEPDKVFPEDKSGFTVKKLLENNYIQTNSVMYRRRESYNDLVEDGIMPIDWYLHLYHAKFGEIGFIDRIMSAYRRHEGGIWWGSRADQSAIWKKYGIAHLRMYVEILRLFRGNKTYSEVTNSHIDNLIGQFVETDSRYGSKLIQDSISSQPESIEHFINFLYEIKIEHDKEIKKLGKLVHDAHVELESRQERIMKLEKQLEDIRNTAVWRIRNKIIRSLRSIKLG